MLDFCVIGTGISGSTIAKLLNQKFSVNVYDKAKGIGGRSSFKRLNGKIGFDHGLQYLSPRSLKFKRFTKELTRKKILKFWGGNHKFLNKSVKKKNKHIKLIGVNGNNDISKYQLKNIKCYHQYELSKINRLNKVWNLQFQNGQVIKSKNLIVSIPFPQCKKLLSKFVRTSLFKNKVIMNSSLTVLLMTNKTSNNYSSYFTNDKILGWVSNENSKKRFTYNKDLWVLQSTFEYGKKNIDNYINKKTYFTKILLNRFKNITKIKISKIYFTHIHGWKYSSNSKPLKSESYWDRKIGLGICGDWFGGPRLEDGWLSANNLFKKIVGKK